MAITDDCGSHCGIRSNAEGTITTEGHCDCRQPCHRSGIPPAPRRTVNGKLVSGPGVNLPPGTPMCARWYERAGEHRPWLPEPDRARP